MGTGAIVVGAHVNGLGVIRALGRRGVPTVSVVTRPFDIAHRSRWVCERVFLPALHDDHSALVDLLERRADDWRGWTVIPTNDDALVALGQQHDRLSRTYRLLCQPWENAAPLVDKDRMHDLAVGAGLDVPRCLGRPSSLDDAGSLRFALVVKPVRHDRLITTDGVKLFIVGDARELARATARLSAIGLDARVFEFVDGPDSEIVVYCVHVDRHGRAGAGITVRKLRQNPPRIGGARAAVVVDDIPAVRDATLALLERAGHRGLAFAEFKRDPATGRHLFIEVNTRPVLFNGILPPAGVDLVSTAFAESIGETMSPGPGGWRGAWIHLQADVLATLRYRAEEHLALRRFLEPYRRSHVFAVWSISDPRPFALQTALLARRAAHAAGAIRPPGTSRVPSAQPGQAPRP